MDEHETRRGSGSGSRVGGRGAGKARRGNGTPIVFLYARRRRLLRVHQACIALPPPPLSCSIDALDVSFDTNLRAWSAPTAVHLSPPSHVAMYIIEP